MAGAFLRSSICPNNSDLACSAFAFRLPQLDLIQQQQPGAFGLQPVKKTRRLVRRNPAPRPNPNSGGFKLTKRNRVRR